MSGFFFLLSSKYLIYITVIGPKTPVMKATTIVAKFSIMYESVSPNAISVQSNFKNIPVNLFSRSINELLHNDVIEIADFKDETIATHGLKYVAEETGCKSAYLFAIKSLEDKFIGILAIDYTKRKTNLDIDSINHLQNHASSIGGVLMSYLSQ